ncbi:pyridoxal phosphate-dependent aminotransferase [Vulcanisaeta sp. JCM 14467]|uniref:pyridoxal phosphate-dependent aminotransferase n=1 Tax=Vulcanisaeta sp. JCM 14467 TaxID=1295370 RepID=UPI000A84DDCD|nr:histidinol-phosphate transaminase [Vulcanisaeta sp. JCM 14467]
MEVRLNRHELKHEPLGTPGELIELIRECVNNGCYSHYPTELGDELREALSTFEGVEPGITYVFNGATEALQLLFMNLRPRRVVIPVPNYSDYLRLGRLVNSEVRLIEYWGRDDLANLIINEAGPGTVVILSNPNSPIGYLIGRDQLLVIAEELGRRGSVLIVDESFMDFVGDNQSLIRDVQQYDNVYVVKSYTKFLAIPGLRVGAVYTRNDIGELVPTWPVNSIAEYAVSRYMRRAHEFRRLTIKYVEEERDRLVNSLRELGISVYESRTHYFMIRHEPWLGEELLKHGVLIRDLSNIPPLMKGYFRVSIKSKEIDDSFLDILLKLKKSKNNFNF